MKTEFISIRISGNIKKRLEERAELLGISISELIRSIIFKDLENK